MRGEGRIALVVVAVALTLVAAGCGSSSNSSSNGSSSGTQTTHLAKTKFVLHAGLAFGAFHRYIYKPYKSGRLTTRHKLTLLKSALAAAFAYHETKIALNDARSSPLLRKALSPLLALQDRLRSMATRLRGGDVSAAGVPAANSVVNSIRSESARAGQPITDQPTPSLGG